jgi:hypothetical protein
MTTKFKRMRSERPMLIAVAYQFRVKGFYYLVNFEPNLDGLKTGTVVTFEQGDTLTLPFIVWTDNHIDSDLLPDRNFAESFLNSFLKSKKLEVVV